MLGRFKRYLAAFGIALMLAAVAVTARGQPDVATLTRYELCRWVELDAELWTRGSRGEGLEEAKSNVDESTALELANQLGISKDEAAGLLDGAATAYHNGEFECKPPRAVGR